jgi:poly-gamma-glutamate synthase PgsB/CapB
MLYSFLLIIIVVFLVAEKCIHRARLERIPIRIHVNGTRGKSTVTRLTAELLRRAGIPTLAKTTGDHPVMILPDGRSVPIRRRAPARIQEQMRFVGRAAREQARAIVLECMALDPALQQASEEAMVRSTIGVITNSRPDHLEVMGGSPESVADALSRTIPETAVLVTPLGPGTNRFREVATRRHRSCRR